MKLKELMRQYPRTVAPDETIGIAAQTLLWHGIRHLPVVEGGKLLGIVSERDLAAYQARVGREARKHPVREAMGKPPRTAAPDDAVTEAAGRMAEAKIGCLPITEQGRLVGLVTSTDILAAQVREILGGSPPQGPIVRDVMTRDPVTARADDSLLDAAERLQRLNVRHLPVVDGEHRVIGMLSDRDLRSAVGYLAQVVEEGNTPQAEFARLTVKQAMSRDVIATQVDRPLRVLAAELAGMQVGALPVTDDDGRLVGIVSVVDVLRGLAA